MRRGPKRFCITSYDEEKKRGERREERRLCESVRLKMHQEKQGSSFPLFSNKQI
jgi:hypothetical protein